MSTSPGSHAASSTSIPAIGDPLSAATMRAIINAFISTYNAHDEDGSIHFQSGTLAQRPSSADDGTVYLTTDSPRNVFVWNSGGWVELDYAASGGAAPDQKFYLFATRI